MINAELGHVKTLEEFYSEIRRQQEEAHGDDYCEQHDAIKKYMKYCDSYKELGTHQGGTAACATAFAAKLNNLCNDNTDIEFENGKLSISIDEKNSIHMKGPVSDIKEIKINL